MWYQKAKRNCVAHDVGSTHVLPVDLNRIFGGDGEARVERGRKKIAEWLAFIDDVESYNKPGCENCGLPKCNGDDGCRQRRIDILILKDSLPLDQAIEMNMAKWFYALKLAKRMPILGDINI